MLRVSASQTHIAVFDWIASWMVPRLALHFLNCAYFFEFARCVMSQTHEQPLMYEHSLLGSSVPDAVADDPNDDLDLATLCKLFVPTAVPELPSDEELFGINAMQPSMTYTLADLAAIQPTRADHRVVKMVSSDAVAIQTGESAAVEIHSSPLITLVHFLSFISAVQLEISGGKPKQTKPVLSQSGQDAVFGQDKVVEAAPQRRAKDYLTHLTAFLNYAHQPQAYHCLELDMVLAVLQQQFGTAEDVQHRMLHEAQYLRQQQRQFTQVLKTLKQSFKSVQYRKAVQQRLSDTKRQTQEYDDYVRWLFTPKQPKQLEHANPSNQTPRRKRLVVVRIDLGYAKSPHHRQHQLSVFKRHIGLLFKHKDRLPCFKHLRGYVCGIEYGLIKGWHAHLMLFYNGDRVQHDYALGQQVGEEWQKIVNNDLAKRQASDQPDWQPALNPIFFNCNAKKPQYQRCGIGRFSSTDPNFAQDFQYILETMHYLTKPHSHFHLKDQKKQKLLSRGERG